jgi:hypothetical protein
LFSFLNYGDLTTSSTQNNDEWYDSVLLASMSACARSIDGETDNGCKQFESFCVVSSSTLAGGMYDWPDVYNCNKAVKIPQQYTTQSSNLTMFLYGAFNPQTGSGFIRIQTPPIGGFQRSQEAFRVYISGSVMVVNTYGQANPESYNILPMTGSTISLTNPKVLALKVENGTTLSLFENGTLLCSTTASYSNVRMQSGSTIYWLDSNFYAGDYQWPIKSMMMYTSSLSNVQIGSVSNALLNNITGSF